MHHDPQISQAVTATETMHSTQGLELSSPARATTPSQLNARKKPPKKPKYEIDLFRKHKHDKFASKVLQGSAHEELVPEWKKIAATIAVPVSRRVVLSSSDDDASEDEEDIIETRQEQAHSNDSAVQDAVVEQQVPSTQSSQRSVTQGISQAEKERGEQLALDIAGKQYDSLYGSGRFWQGRSAAFAAETAPSADKDRAQESIEDVTHWSADRRLAQAHTADRYFEALQLRKWSRQNKSRTALGSQASASAQEEKEEEDRMRTRHLLGMTTITTDGKYDVHLARVRSKRAAAMKVLGLEPEQTAAKIEGLPRIPMPRPGEVVANADDVHAHSSDES